MMRRRIIDLLPKVYLTTGLVIIATLLLTTGCTDVEKIPGLSDLRGGTPSINKTVAKRSSYYGSMQFQIIDHAADSLCNATITADIAFTLTENDNAKISGEGTVTYANVAFDQSFVAPQCPVCTIIGTPGTFTITGERDSNPIKKPDHILLHPAAPQGLSEQQTTAQCRTEQQNGTQETHHVVFALQQAGFFDTWRVDTSGLPTTFSFEVAGRSASGALTLEKVL